MNRTLQNTVSALMAAGALLVLGLVATVPTPVEATTAVHAPALATSTAARAGHGLVAAIAEADPRTQQLADRVKAETRRLETRTGDLDAAADLVTLGLMLATSVGLVDAFENLSAAETAETEPQRKARNAARRTRQNLVMPFFSFSPRG